MKLIHKVSVIFLVICLFVCGSDRPNVQDHDLVERLQQPYVDALHSYIRIKRPNVSIINLKKFTAFHVFWHENNILF